MKQWNLILMAVRPPSIPSSAYSLLFPILTNTYFLQVPASNVREWLLNGIESGMEVKSPQSYDPLRSAMAQVLQVSEKVEGLFARMQ